MFLDEKRDGELILREAAKIVASSDRLSRHGGGGQCIMEVLCTACNKAATLDSFGNALWTLHHRVSDRKLVDGQDVIDWWNQTLPDKTEIIRVLD